MSDMSEEDQIAALYRSGEMTDTASRAFSAIQGRRATESIWTLAGQSLIVLGESQLLVQLVALADAALEPGPIFFNRVCRQLRTEKRYLHLRSLPDASLPDTHAMRALGFYYAGVAQIAARKLGDALPWFRRFRTALPASALTTPFLDETMQTLLANGTTDEANARYARLYAPRLTELRAASPFVMDDRLNIVLRQGRLVATPDEVIALRQSPPEPVAHGFTIIDREAESTDDGSACFFVSADPAYIQTFLPGFMAALAEKRAAARLHVNIINPTPESVAAARAMAEKYPALRVEISGIETRLRSSTVYACARVFVLPELLRRQRVPVIALDIDFAVETPVAALADQPSLWDCDFALFDTGRDEPASVYQASIMLFSPEPVTVAFLDDVGRLSSAGADAVPRLNWMLDQAAILSALETHKAEGSGLRFQTLNRLMGARFEAMGSVLWQESDQKFSLRGGLKLWSLQRT